MDILDFFVPTGLTEEVIVSDRFKDENGEIIPFIIKAVSEEDSRKIRIFSMTDKGRIDRDKYLTLLVCKAVTSPNLCDSTLQSAYGVLGEDRLLSKMLLAGEFALLAKKVQALCGFDINLQDRISEIKN